MPGDLFWLTLVKQGHQGTGSEQNPTGLVDLEESKELSIGNFIPLVSPLPPQSSSQQVSADVQLEVTCEKIVHLTNRYSVSNG